MLTHAEETTDWHYLDHGFWINGNGELQRLSSTNLPSEEVATMRRPLHGRPPVDGGTSHADDETADWFYVGNGWWMSENGELSRLSE